MLVLLVVIEITADLLDGIDTQAGRVTDSTRAHFVVRDVLRVVVATNSAVGMLADQVSTMGDGIPLAVGANVDGLGRRRRGDEPKHKGGDGEAHD